MHCGYFDRTRKGSDFSFLTPTVIAGRRPFRLTFALKVTHPSHAGTVVLECCKDDVESQRKNVHSASFFEFFLYTRYRLGRGADFDDQYVIRRRIAQGCAFWGPRKQIFTF